MFAAYIAPSIEKIEITKRNIEFGKYCRQSRTVLW